MKTKALYARHPMDFEVREITLPKLGADDVLVRSTRAACAARTSTSPRT